MSRTQRKKSKSGYYHIMLRGNELKNIFLDDNDRLRFLEILGKKKEGKEFYLHAFCLMDNHVHLLISEGTEDIAKVMKRVNVSYVQYFNKKYRRIGHLFQDRYNSEAVEDDKYVMALMRYILRNPVKAGLVRKAREYKWSSYGSYINEHDYFRSIVDLEPVLELFSNRKEAAQKHYIEYINQESNESFMDISEAEEVIDEKEAQDIFEDILSAKGLSLISLEPRHIDDDMIREFRMKTKLSIRKIAAIMNINKDRVNRVIRE